MPAPLLSCQDGFAAVITKCVHVSKNSKSGMNTFGPSSETVSQHHSYVT